MLRRWFSMPLRFFVRRTERHSTPPLRSKKNSYRWLELEGLEERTLPSALQLSLSGPATVVPGMDVHYLLTITNTDSADAWNVDLSGTLPSGTTFLSQEQTSGPDVALTNSGNAIDDVFDTLPAGATAVIDLAARANADLANGAALSTTITASDDNPDDDVSASVSTTVAPGIQIVPIPDQQNVEGDTVSLQPSATSPSGAGLTYSVTGLPDGLTFSADTNTISGTIAPGAAVNGPFHPEVTASDGSTSSSLDFVWNVAPRIQFAPVDDQQNLEGDTVNVQASATSPDGNPIQYSADGLPDGLSIQANTGQITGTIAAGTADSDSYDVTLTATDGTYSATQTFSWDVAPRITFADLSDRQNVEGATVSLQTSASSPDGLALQYGADGLPDGLSIDSNTGLISGTLAPGTAVDGPYDVTVTATDGTYSGAQVFTWDVTPRVTFEGVDDQQAMEGETVSFQVSAGTPDNAQLNYSASGLPNGLNFDDQTATVSGTLAPGSASDQPYRITVTASDGTYQSSLTFDFTVTPRVSFQPLTDEQALEGEEVSYQAQAVDATGGTLQYSLTGQPDGLSIDPDSGLISGTLANDAALDGPYSLAVTASDGAYSASQSFTLDVGPQVSLSPVADQHNVEGDVVSLQPVATTDISTPLYFAAGDLPAGLSLDPDTGAITGQLTPGSAASYETTLTVSAGDSWDSYTFAWTVDPRITFGTVGDQHSSEGDNVSVQTTATAVDGAGLTYFADNLPDGLSIDPDSGAISGKVAQDSAYNLPYRVTVYATDDTYVGHADLSWQIDSSVTFNAVTPNQHNTVGDKVSIQVQAQSGLGHVVYTAAGLPSGLGIDPYDGTISGTLASDAAFPIPLAVTVDASDGSASNRSVFTWQVDAAPLGSPTIVARHLTSLASSFGTEGGSAFQGQLFTFPADGDHKGELSGTFAFVDNRPESDPTNYTLMVDWGDGAGFQQVDTSGASVSALRVSIPLSHTYSDIKGYNLLLRLSVPDGTRLTVPDVATPVQTDPPTGFWPTLTGIAQALASGEIKIGGKTYTLPGHPDFSVSDNLRNLRDSAETVANDVITTVQAAGQTIQAKFVETWQAGANTVEWLVDQTGKGLAVVGNVIVQATEAATKAFVDQLKAWGGNIVDLWNRIVALRNLNINVDPQAIINQIVNNPQGMVQNLLAGTKLGVQQYFDPTQIVNRLQGIVFNWLFNNDDVRQQVSGLSQILANADFSSLDGIKKLVLDVAYQLSNASAINLDFLKQTIAQVTGYDPDTVMAQVTQFQQLLQNGTVSLDALKSQLPGFLDGIFGSLKQQALDYLTNSVVPRLIAEAVSSLDPTGVSQALKDIYNAVDWFTRNAPKLVNVLNSTLGAVQTAANSTPQQVAGLVYQAIDQAIPPLLDIGATKLGIGGVPLWLTGVLQKLDLRYWVRLGIQKLWQSVKNLFKPDQLAAAAGGNYVWLSGYKVIADETAILQRNGQTLSQADYATIKSRIEDEGGKGQYGGVGQYAALEKILTSALLQQSTGGTPPPANVGAAFDAYFVLPQVSAERVAQQTRIAAIEGEAYKSTTSTGRTVRNWTNYIYTALNNQDAQGNTLDEYESAIVAAGADLNVQSQSTHGHHIIWKNGGNTSPVSLGYSKDARDILLAYGINPYTDRANLEYAPWQGHRTEAMKFMDGELQLLALTNKQLNPDSSIKPKVIALVKRLGWEWMNGKMIGVKQWLTGTVPFKQ
jgi:uncharacterized repeat protein (TIGR01451 family)